MLLYGMISKYFYPRSPCGERRELRGIDEAVKSNFYPRSPCGERLFAVVVDVDYVGISIHALLAESDTS